jgi:hypothetical protein
MYISGDGQPYKIEKSFAKNERKTGKIVIRQGKINKWTMSEGGWMGKTHKSLKK